MRYTQEQYERAKSASLLDYLQQNGYELQKSGNEYRHTKPGSITIRNNLWFRHSEQRGGCAIDFLTQIENRSWTEAVLLLSGNEAPSKSLPLPVERPSPPFVLPEPAANNHRVFAYLHLTRGIAANIIREQLQRGTVYQSRDYGNCVFVGRDAGGEPKYATLRGTSQFSGRPFRADVKGSDKSVPFYIEGGCANRIVIATESPIDALSHKTQFPQDNSYRISLGGVSDKALSGFLREHPKTEKIIFALDNDEAGREAAQKLAEKYQSMGFLTGNQIPVHKDWNDDCVRNLEANRQHDDE